MAALTCALSTAATIGCKPEKPGEERAQPEMRLESVQFRAYRGGDLSAVGSADELVYRRDVGDLEARGASIQFPQEGAAPVRVSAPILIGDVPARAFEARGGIVAVRGTDEARTESARYAEADGLLRGDRPVEVTGAGYRLVGPSFTLDPRSGDLALRGGVRLVAAGPAGATGRGR